MTVPTIWVAPVRSHWMPMTTSPFDWALAGATGQSIPATPTRAAMRMVRHVRIGCLPSSRISVREWPYTKVASDVPPEPVQPLGLEDEEHHDEGTEQRETERGNQVQHGRLREEGAAERLHRVPDDDRQQRDEGGPEDRAQHGAQAADDDHGQVV